ncbi:hypothetical protein LJY18_02245 [Pseudomonas sp. MMS21-TM103]|uniref:hypothetical protein n=1 Tax=Pseudomonas sp. MMS21 TM103 TaxID=2886506 RepID=UPI001EE0061A|nr:hypothetical protein [Pseudomonas sp. MMS21 TM103]MCG4452123.1 hypothetical protein [Pseudomonas sp. MMS21 TM103]
MKQRSNYPVAPKIMSICASAPQLFDELLGLSAIKLFHRPLGVDEEDRLSILYTYLHILDRDWAFGFALPVLGDLPVVL